MAGYDAAPGAAVPVSSATVNRVIGRVDPLGNVDTQHSTHWMLSAVDNARGAVTTSGHGVCLDLSGTA